MSSVAEADEGEARQADIEAQEALAIMKNALANSGLPPEMPLAPGNKCAADPVPEHVIAAEDEIPWLARDKQKWTRERVAAHFGSQGLPRTGAPRIEDLPPRPQLPDIPAYRVWTSAKEPKGGF